MQTATARELHRTTERAKNLLDLFKPLTPDEKKEAGIVTAHQHQQTKQGK